MTDDQGRILDLLAEGKIDAGEAERLLAALSKSTTATDRDGSVGSTRPRARIEVMARTSEDVVPSEPVDHVFEVGASPKLVVRNKDGEIDVNVGPEGEIRTHAEFNGAGAEDYEVTQDGDTVHVVAKAKSSKGRSGLLGFFGMGPGRIDVSATVPPGAEVDVKSRNGDVSATGVANGGTLKSTNGDVTLEGGRGDFEVGTTNGDVGVKDSEYTGKLRSTNGDVFASGTLGSINGATVNGDVRVSGDFTPGGESRLKSTNGDVKVLISGKPSLRVDAASSVGSVRHDLSDVGADIESRDSFPVGGKLKATLGDGEAALVIRTTTGSVEIESAPGADHASVGG